MSVKDYHCPSCEMNADKSKWGDGPWQQEPDRLQWEHAGLICIAHRNHGGAWCGYVGLPPGHPAHGLDYADVHGVDVHGGLTYAEACAGHVCHDPKPGKPDGLWWLGWDAEHGYDLAPARVARCPEHLRGGTEEHYWTLAEVQGETNQLSESLAAVGVAGDATAPLA